jgi:hypothetical protein
MAYMVDVLRAAGRAEGHQSVEDLLTRGDTTIPLPSDAAEMLRGEQLAGRLLCALAERWGRACIILGDVSSARWL